MKTVALIVQDGFAPFEFGLACEAFGLDSSDDGIPNFDFRILAPEPGAIASNIGVLDQCRARPGLRRRGRSRGRDPDSARSWGNVDPRVTDVVRARSTAAPGC